ncbi:endospore germination permease [Alicyclobacillus sp.]|uniref:GerAB/ArcD/ProY family transporter n=1 Tax=Alicyclobacillus sp. TaxID=61169 RepID=UPI0025B95E82|nr:endospore germination permease [Alicyclobacillus sp.]MCL6516429.1 spore germination protein [Alicyclobacillus sp.]
MEAPRFQTVTFLEATATVISTIIGVGVLALPRIAAEAGNSGAPLVTLLGIVLSTVGLVLVTALGMRFPRQSPVEYSERIIGRWPARGVSLLLVAFFATLTGLAAREFAEVVVTSVLPRTPVEVTAIAMLALTAWCCRANLTTFAYAHLFYLPFVLAPGLVIVALSLKNAALLNLLPVVGNHPDAGAIAAGALTVSALFQGSFVVAMVIPGMRRPRRAMAASLVGICVAGGLYLAIVIATVGVFGAAATAEFLWPTLELAKTTLLPGEVLERLDAAFLMVWVTAVFTTLYSTYALTARALRDLFRLGDHSLWVTFLLPYVFLIALVPPDIVRLYQVIEWVGRFGLWITIGYPCLLWLVCLLGGARGDEPHAN